MDLSSTERNDILLVEEDLGHASEVAALLAEHADVITAASAEEALPLLPTRKWELIIAGIELPGMDGLEFIARIRENHRNVACLVLSHRQSFEDAVQALRCGADDYLAAPCEAAELVGKANELMDATLRRRRRGREVVLAVGAHPDDVEIGVGGILLSHVALRHDVTMLILTGGEHGGIVAERAAEARSSAELLGVRLVHAHLADTGVSESLDTISVIKEVVDQIDPTTVYTHTHRDVHQDHRNVHSATLVASRGIPRVYCYQSPSTTVEFQPTRFIAIDEHMDRKLDLVGAYASQAAIRRYLEPDLLQATARYWSRFTTSRFVEPLEVVRESLAAAPAPRQARHVELVSEVVPDAV